MTRLILLCAIAFFAAISTANAQSRIAEVEDVSRSCDISRLQTMKTMLSQKEKDVVVVESWTAFGRAYADGQTALDAMQRKALMGADGPEKVAQDAIEEAKKCQSVFETVVSSGGNINLALITDINFGDPDGLAYLLSKGANPAARDPSRLLGTFGMEMLRLLSGYDFVGDEDRLNTYLNILIPRMGRLNGVKDSHGRPVVYYALGLNHMIVGSPNQKTVDAIIKRLAAAGANVSAPWKPDYLDHTERAADLYQGFDSEVMALLRR